MKPSVVTNELLEVVKNKIDILMEAIEVEENPGQQIAYKTQAATGSFDPHPGSGVQVIIEIRVKEEYFLEDGEIIIITETPPEFLQEPYKEHGPVEDYYNKIKKDR